MVEERTDGWYVVNVADARWVQSPDFGKRALFEKEGVTFPHQGVNIAVMEPGKPSCRYHRENAQEDFLVLSGECDLIVRGEVRRLKAWDFFHCPPGVDHVFVGAGDGPCAVLMIGHRPERFEYFYPADETAARFGAASKESTPDPRVAYADAVRPAPCETPPPWPPA